MNFRVFVRHLNDRVLHIATQEANKRGFEVKRLVEVNRVNILSVSCDSVKYLPKLVDTLETSRKTSVFAVKDNDGRYVDLNQISRENELFAFNLDALTIQMDELEAAY